MQYLNDHSGASNGAIHRESTVYDFDPDIETTGNDRQYPS